MADYIPQLEGVNPLSSDALRLGLNASLRTPLVSVQSLDTPMELSSINWKAVDARQLMDAIGIAYAQDRMRTKAQQKRRRRQERATEGLLSRAPKVANSNRKKVRQRNRMAMEGIFRDAAYMLGMKQQKLY